MNTTVSSSDILNAGILAVDDQMETCFLNGWKGNNLHRDLSVGLYTAVLGGKTQIKTPKGNVTIDSTKGTPNGKELRLRGLGMPVYAKKSKFGNLLVKVDIVLPEPLSEEEIVLFRKFAALRK